MTIITFFRDAESLRKSKWNKDKWYIHYYRILRGIVWWWHYQKKNDTQITIIKIYKLKDIIPLLAETFKVSNTQLKRNIKEGGLWYSLDTGWERAEIEDLVKPPLLMRLGKRNFIKVK